MRGAFLRSRKGMLFTLVTIVLFLLMLSELITYVTFSINYDSLSTASSTTFGSSAFASTIKSQSAAWLHSSLYNALGALVKYESTPSQRNGNFINNTALALKSLVTNGTVYGTNLNATMGGSTLKVYLNYTRLAGLAQNVNVSIKNSSITVFQGGPFSLNATLTGLMVINSTYGISTYPLSITTGIPLNGTVSLYSAETADTSPIKAQANYPIAQLVGNTYAIKGSTSPFMFAYGTVVYEAGTPSCSAVPAAEQNKNFILATPTATNIPQNACGMAGVITYTVNTAGPQTPYLVYYSPSNVLSLLQNGTSVLLDGKGLALYNLSQIQNAVQNGYTYASGYAPSFLDQAQGSYSSRSLNGMFSFALDNRAVLSLNGMAASVNALYPISTPVVQGNTVTMTAWVKLTGGKHISGACCGPRQEIFGADSSYNNEVNPIIAYNDSGTQEAETWVCVNGCWQEAKTPANTIIPGQWTFLTSRYNGSYVSIWVNGVQRGFATANGVLSTGATSNYIYIGSRGGGASFFNGSIADVQLYNSSLSSTQINQLYLNGLASLPVSNQNLLGWWPLNGNANDYGPKQANGTPSNVLWAGLNHYTGNPILEGSFYNKSSNNQVAGALNCGTLNQCANTSLQHLYLAALALKGNTSVQGALFNGQTSYINVPALITPTSHTIEFWMKTFTTQTSPGQSMVSLWGSFNARIAIYGSGSGISFNRDGGGSISSGVAPNVGQWYQVAVVLSSSKIASIYINGVLKGTGVAPSQIESWTIDEILGSDVSPPAGSFNGILSNVQFYNSALSGAQVAALYANGINNRPIVPANTIAWWPLNGTINDYSGLSENGINYGAAFVTSYTNQTNGTTTQPQAFHLGDAVIPNVANFDGIATDNVVITKDTSWPAGSQAVSIFAWVKSKQSATYPFVVQYGRAGTSFQNWLLGWYNGAAEVDDWGNGAVAGAAVNDGKWHFVGFTYAGGGTTAVTVYTDGSPTAGNFCATCVPNVYTGAGSTATIGWGCCSSFYNGSIADVQIYNASLSQAQVNQLYTNDSVLGIGPVAWFPLSSGYNGLLNQTPNLIFQNNPGAFASCTASNVINGQCGVREVQP